MEVSEIKKLFKEKLCVLVVSIKDRSLGVDQKVKIVQTTNGYMVLKIPCSDKSKIIKEIIGTDLCHKVGVPAPQVILAKNKYLVEEYINGKNLDEINCKKQVYANLYKQLGQILRKLHTVRMQGFGPVGRNGKGEFKTERDYIHSWFPRELKRLKKTTYYSAQQIKQISRFYNEHRNLLDNSTPVLLHNDIHDHNIIAKGTSISGIIDFGDLLAGATMDDFSLMYIDHFGTYKFDKLVEGYGHVRIKEIEFYVFLRLTWLIASSLMRKKMCKETSSKLPNRIKRYNELVGL